MNESYSAGQWKVYWSRRGWDLSFADSRGVLSIHRMSNLLHRWKINMKIKKRKGRQSEMSRKQSQSASVWWAASAKKCGNYIPPDPLCQEFNGVGVEVGQKPSMLFFYHTYRMNMCVHLCQMQEAGGGQGGSWVQLYNDQNRTCFLFPTCVFSPNYTRNSESHRKEEKKTPSFSSLTIGGGWKVGGKPFFFQSRASCFLCMVLFVCISSYSLGRLCMEGRKKDSSPTAFDAHGLWSHVNALSVKSFCCPSA